MGLFDNRLISGLIPDVFLPKQAPNDPGLKYVYQTQSGCGVRIYPNEESAGHGRPVQDLFFEIQACETDRSITDVGTPFGLTLHPTQPWDELIQPDDIIRVFMGNRISSIPNGGDFYNFANQSLKHRDRRPSGQILMPLPNSAWSYNGDRITYRDTRPVNVLYMNERFCGKVDRVERNEDPPGKDTGTVTGFTVSGKSLGGILQEISLYYNENLPGLNAVNVFYNSSIIFSGSPDELVKNFLTILLTAVPFPQWQLPEAFANDMNADILKANVALATETIKGVRAKMQAARGGSNTGKTAESAITEIDRLLTQIEANPKLSPLAVLSLGGFKKTLGKTLNLSFLNNATTGAFDVIKHLSNDPFNEFWVDLCPNGNPEGGPTTSAALVPTVVMRQRPYNLTDDMFSNAASYCQPFRSKIKRASFGPQQVPDVSATLIELIAKGGFTVFGAMADTDKIQLEGGPAGIRDSLGGYRPSFMSYKTGLSSHDRLNGFQVTGAYASGQQNADRVVLAANGGFAIDVDSIRKYGLRMMELSTSATQFAESKNQQEDHYNRLKTFTRTLANWYIANPMFLNGMLVGDFVPEARLGVPCRFVTTRITPSNPYPRLELFYVQGITDSYQFGQPIRTTLTVTRGIRYNLGKASGSGQASGLGSVRERVAGFFKGLGGGSIKT